MDFQILQPKAKKKDPTFVESFVVPPGIELVAITRSMHGFSNPSAQGKKKDPTFVESFVVPPGIELVAIT